jgi:hypothetical protein
MTKLTDRPVTELVTVVLVGTVSAVVLMLTLAVLVSKLVHPDGDVGNAARQLGDVIASLIALLAGVAVGRGTAAGEKPVDPAGKGDERL